MAIGKPLDPLSTWTGFFLHFPNQAYGTNGGPFPGAPTGRRLRKVEYNLVHVLSVHVEDPAAALAAVIDDRRIGTAAVDAEAVAGVTAGACQSIGVEQIEEPPAASLLVHGVGSEEMTVNRPDDQRNRSAPG